MGKGASAAVAVCGGEGAGERVACGFCGACEGRGT